jgi:hypothetical protein
MTNEQQQKPKSIWGTIGDIARGVANGMNKQEPQRPVRGSNPKPRKPCGGCGGK